MEKADREGCRLWSRVFMQGMAPHFLRSRGPDRRSQSLGIGALFPVGGSTCTVLYSTVLYHGNTPKSALYSLFPCPNLSKGQLQKSSLHSVPFSLLY